MQHSPFEQPQKKLHCASMADDALVVHCLKKAVRHIGCSGCIGVLKVGNTEMAAETTAVMFAHALVTLQIFLSIYNDDHMNLSFGLVPQASY